MRIVVALLVVASTTCTRYTSGDDDDDGPDLCDVGFTFCDPLCVDLQSDPNHCGDCTLACDAGWSCVGGFCCEIGCAVDLDCGSLCRCVPVDCDGDGTLDGGSCTCY